MNLSCEKIISENEKLKLTDLEKSCLNIYEYLKLHHHVNFLSIDIRKNDLIENIFAHNNGDIKYFTNTLSFKENTFTDIIFNFLSEIGEKVGFAKGTIKTVESGQAPMSKNLFEGYVKAFPLMKDILLKLYLKQFIPENMENLNIPYLKMI